MKKFRLLDFFRTGKLGEVEIGMSQTSVFTELGQPDRWANYNGDVNKQPFMPTEATVWGYGAIELMWMKPDSGLHMISFGVDSLHWSTEDELDRWVFHNKRDVTWTRTYFKAALEKEGIPYQDTGLEIFTFDKGTYKAAPFTENSIGEYDSEDIFGTVVLKSGVQVRYGRNDYIIKISMPGRWLFKGSEQFIVWNPPEG